MKIRGADLRLTHEYGQGFRLSMHITGDHLNVARAWVDELKESDISIEIKKWRNKRSLDANAYAWVLIDQIAEATQQPKTDVYRAAIREVGGNTTTVCVQDKAVERLRESWHKNGIGWISETMPSKLKDCTCVILYHGSSDYDTKQMSTLINILIQDAKSLGIETLTPADLERMMGTWQKA